MSPTDTAIQPTLENPPELLRKEAPTAIHGIDNLNPNPSAIGASPNSIPGNSTPHEQAPTQPVASQPAAQPQALTVEERIKSDAELQKYLEADRSRVINAARQKWDSDVLQKKMAEDRAFREAQQVELAKRAQAGDEAALLELGKSTLAQVTKELTAQEYAQQWFNEVDTGVQAITAGDPALAAQLNIRNFRSVPEWLAAIHANGSSQTQVQAEATKLVDTARLQAERQREIERLADAKAADYLAATRSQLPTPDKTQPVANGGTGTPRQWNTLAEASTLLNEDKISLDEYRLADAWYREGRIEAGIDFRTL